MRTLLYIILSMFILLTACEKVELGTDEEDKQEKTSGGDSNNKESSSEDKDNDTTTTKKDSVVIHDDTIKVDTKSSFPEPWTLWNGHVVIYKDQTSPDSAIIVLLSREEKNVYSVYKSGYETEAQEYADSYVEDGMDGWEIPDESVGEWLRDSCNAETHLHDVNAMLDMTIVPRSSSGNYRYLCSGAKRTFAFVSGSTILDAGKSKRYPLRLVKWVHLYK